jgi:hypothetical protein
MNASLYPRRLASRIAEALVDTPVVLLAGPRQAGKTTLARAFVDARRRYLTLDDASTLASARTDPAGLVRSLDAAVIDEVQRAPELLSAIKYAVDIDRRPGRFLLTGSADVMTMPNVSDSLAGRMETLSLLPLAGCELRSSPGNWLSSFFAGKPPRIDAAASREFIGGSLVDAVLRGGYPEAVQRRQAHRRTVWLQQYVDALLQRDARDIATIEKLDHLPRLLRALGLMSGQLCNIAALAGQIGLDAKTAARYLAILERMYLVRRVEPWFANRLSRIIKTPKIHFLDSGLLAAITGLTSAQDRRRFGHALETFVYAELRKQTSWSDDDFEIYIYRDKDQVEVDFVVENSAGAVVGIEVKASATVTAADFTGLRRLSALADDHFRLGVVFYDGTESLPMGNRCWALPLATLWMA